MHGIPSATHNVLFYIPEQNRIYNTSAIYSIVILLKTTFSGDQMNSCCRHGKNVSLKIDFGELIQAVTNQELKTITDQLNFFMYTLKHLYPAICTETIGHAYSTSPNAIDYTQKKEREFLLAEGTQETDLGTVMSIGANTGNDPNEIAVPCKHYMLQM